MGYQINGRMGGMIKSIILIGAIFLTFALSSDAGISTAGSKGDTKMSSALSNALRSGNAESQSLKSDAIGSLSISRDAINFDDGEMAQVYITLYELTEQSLEKLKGTGVSIEIYDKSQNLVQGRVKLDVIEELSGSPFVKFIDLPNYGFPNTGSVQSEGGAVLRANEARDTFGVDGAGVQVGVISDGLNGLTESLGSEDLPSSGVSIPTSPLTGGGISIDDPCPGFTPVTSTPVARQDVTTGAEGTAMLEIIHDIAPGAELFFAPGFASDLEHRRARRCLTEVVDVIADDIAFFNAGPYDGTSPVSLESTASVISGVANFIAVGNQAKEHYQGIFSDSDGDGFHEFDVSLGLPFSNNSGETLNVTIPPGNGLSVVLQWNDPFGGSGNDYDLGIVDPGDPNALLVFPSINIQDGDDDPTERLDVVNTGLDPITVGIAILNFDAEISKEFDMFVLGDPVVFMDEFGVEQSSVPNNGDADLVLSTGSVGLGAGDPLGQSENEIRSYSSRGPTNDGRTKPELVAPDGVSTTVPGFIPFFGTSAAAPHAAGVAALLLEAEENLTMAKSGSILSQAQSLTPSEISNILKMSAVDLGAPGADNTFGSGRIDALAAVQSVAPQPTASPTPTPTVTPTPSPTTTTQPPPMDQQGESSGGCSISPSLQIGTAAVNLLIPLSSALVIALRIMRRRL